MRREMLERKETFFFPLVERGRGGKGRHPALLANWEKEGRQY